MKNLYVLLILLSILIITNITLNLISNEKYTDFYFTDFNTKPDFNYKLNNFRKHDIYDKLVNYHNFFKNSDAGETGDIKRDLNEKINYVNVKTGSGDRSINEAILSFDERIRNLQQSKTCLNEGQDCFLTIH